MNRSRVITGIRSALAAGLLLLGVACANAGDEGPEQIRAVVLPYLSMAPLHVAAAEGFFEDESLDVEFVGLQRHQELMTALVRGEVDVAAGMLTVSDLVLASKGEPVRVVAGLGTLTGDNCSFIAIVARSELAESGALEDPERLKGLTYDLDPLIPFGYWMDEFLAPRGIRTEDLETVNLPSTVGVPALIAGSIDVTIESEPFLSQLVADDAATVWASVASVVPDYFVSVVLYGPSLLAERREAGVRFMAALQRGFEQYAEGKTERNRQIVSEFSGLSPERVAGTCWPGATLDGTVDPEGFRGYQEWNVRNGFLDEVVPADVLFDLSFIRDAHEHRAR